MSCDVAAAAFLFLASAQSGPAIQPTMAVAVAPPTSVASEPLFADIIKRAGELKARADAYRKATTGAAAAAALPDFEAFKSAIGDLAAQDMKGHLELKARGTDGDLKCILKGIAEDLPKKLNDLMTASTGPAQDAALRDMSYLLNDNVEVITAPPAPAV